MSDNEIDVKDFQEEPSFELMDEIYELGKRALKFYGEAELGDFLIKTAFHYKSRLFELETKKRKLLVSQLLEHAKHNPTDIEVEVEDDGSDDQLTEAEITELEDKGFKVH